MPTLNWIGKEAVINHHLDVPFHLLKDVPELGSGDPGSGNLIVEGDNLLALKALLPYYKGKVKCICIDPPYNTGNEGWAYNDNVRSPAIQKWLGETVGKEGETLDRHDRWLCMMYPRLALLREFLSEDGSIWITLDDNEIHALRYVMDEVFGRQNFIATFVWQKRASPDNDETFATAVHDYVCCYARQKDRCQFNRLPRTEEADARYENLDADDRGPWTSSDLTRREYREHDYYPIKLPSGREVLPAAGRSWSVPKSSFEQLVAENRIWFGPRGDSMPRRKRFLTDVSTGIVPTTWWVKEMFGDNQAAKRLVRVLFPDVQDIFSTPKPPDLIERILQIATNPGDLVLDSFAGSGTTGHAVLKMNASAERPGVRQSSGALEGQETLESAGGPAHSKTQAPAEAPQRRFILVEMDEKIAPDITRERVKRVAEGYTNAKKEAVSGLGGGFRYVRLGETLFDEHGRINEGQVRFADLARHVYFTETGEPLPKERVSAKTPLLGIHHGRAVYLLYNGILKDKSVDGGNVLTSETLAHLPPHDGPKVVYAAGCRFSKARLEREGITFKQTPYAVRTK